MKEKAWQVCAINPKLRVEKKKWTEIRVEKEKKLEEVHAKKVKAQTLGG